MTTLYDCRISAEKEGYSLQANACAVSASAGQYNPPRLYVLSAIGPGSAVKAAAAMLNRTDRQNTTIVFQNMPRELAWWNNRALFGHWSGVRANYARLAMDTWQLLVIAKDRQLVISDDDESLWQFLKGEEFTTPLLRSWLPEITKQLRIRNSIVNLTSFGCKPCHVRIAQDKLDEIVSTLVGCGALKIEEPQEAVS